MEQCNWNCIHMYYEEGFCEPKQIHQITCISSRTCQRIYSKIRRGYDIKRKKTPGHQRTLQSIDIRRVQQLACHHLQWSSSRIAEMAASRGSPKVHSSIIWRLFHTKEYLLLIPRPGLTAMHKSKRLIWCKENVDRDWNKVVFIDESCFQPYRNKVCEWGKMRTSKTNNLYLNT